MTEAAQGELPKHEVFSKPLKVEPVYETWDTPQSYRLYPGGKELPNTLKVWRVQQIGKAKGKLVHPSGAVSRPFAATKDAEPLLPGVSTAKMNGALGVARDRNFLQWGFSASPSKMTPAGRNLFVNCVCYIAKFNGGAANR